MKRQPSTAMSRLVRLGLLLLLVLLSLAIEVSCTEPLTTVCEDLSLTVAPGECAEFLVPCSPVADPSSFTIPTDSLSVHLLLDLVWVRTNRDPLTHSVCTSTSAPEVADVPLSFRYVDSLAAQEAQGTLHLTISGTAVRAVPSATPTEIDSGDVAQLDANATGGTPPYGYTWTPAAGLNAVGVASPLASPLRTTPYRVRVEDAAGVVSLGTVVVEVRDGDVLVEADPETIQAGGFSTLTATPRSGAPPYRYTWYPSEVVSPQDLASTSAVPSQTTRFSVSVEDAAGFTFTGGVDVSVSLSVLASAVFPTIQPGGSTEIVADVFGGVPPYSYVWTPSTGLSDPTLRVPLASPGVTTTYSVTVTDAVGVTASASVTVEVVPTSTLTACFTITPLGPAMIEVDASCSTGSIVEYWYWPDFSGPGAPPDVATTSSTTTFSYATSGPKTVRVEVFDGVASSNAATQIYDVP